MALKNYILELAYNRGGDSSVNLFYNGIHPSDVKGKDTDGPVSLPVFLPLSQPSIVLIKHFNPRAVRSRDGSFKKMICRTGRIAQLQLLSEPPLETKSPPMSLTTTTKTIAMTTKNIKTTSLTTLSRGPVSLVLVISAYALSMTANPAMVLYVI